jgi:hypothetical protein
MDNLANHFQETVSHRDGEQCAITEAGAHEAVHIIPHGKGEQVPSLHTSLNVTLISLSG